jgi:hypothetical protein
MQDRIEQDALELPHAIREHHPDIYAGAWVSPYSAALKAGLDPDSPYYGEAMEYLQAARARWSGWRKAASYQEARSTPSRSRAWRCCETWDGHIGGDVGALAPNNRLMPPLTARPTSRRLLRRLRGAGHRAPVQRNPSVGDGETVVEFDPLTR